MKAGMPSPATLVGDKIGKRTKAAKVEGWSPMDLPVK